MKYEFNQPLSFNQMEIKCEKNEMEYKIGYKDVKQQEVDEGDKSL